MKLHPRFMECRRQQNNVRVAFNIALEKTDLTYVETIDLVCEILLSVTRSALRNERHPDDPSKPADAE